jgi:hypothetical protein
MIKKIIKLKRKNEDNEEENEENQEENEENEREVEDFTIAKRKKKDYTLLVIPLPYYQMLEPQLRSIGKSGRKKGGKMEMEI